MKKFIPLLVLVVAVTCSLNAQSPQIIFKNGGTTSYSLPFGSNASQKFQCFYPALSFPAAQGSITRLYFRSSAAITGSVTYTNFIIKLGQTTSTNYPGAGNADFFTGLTTVYSAASYTLVGATTDYQWFYIDLQIPFAYVQTSSNALVLEMQYSAKTGTGTQNIFGTATSPGTLSSTNVSATSGTINTNRINLGFDFQCSGTPLSGTYTINDLSPLSSTNFQSFSGFVAALRCNGISAPVVANVTTINTQLYEHVQMSAITGASSVNTITINGNNKTLTSLNGTVIYTLSLNGADYTIWNNLTIEASHPTNGFALLMHNQSDNNSFNNCTFKATQASTSSQSAAVIFSNSEVLAIAYGNNGNNNVFTSCTMIGGNYGVSFLGQSGGLISNNQLINSTIKEFLSNGVTSVYTTGTVIRSCIIERPTRTVFNGTTHYGIFSTTLTNSIII